MPKSKLIVIINNIKKKKGGIYIKKINFFLIIISFFTLVFYKNVKAIEEANFYEAEYIDGIYMNRYDPNTKTTYYQKARFFRKSNNNMFSYCVDPFIYFNENKTYYQTDYPNNLTNDQIKKISKIAHFGYNYKNHKESKWYAITQLMIWKEREPFADFYFTDSLNGNRINIYENEIQEINNLISEYDNSFNIEKEYTLVDDERLNLSGNFKYIKSDYSELQITDNSITSIPLKEQVYNFELYKQDAYYNNPYLFYTSEETQTQLQTGDFDKEIINLKVNVIPTSLKIIKIDKDTNTETPSGDASINNAIFQLLDENNNPIKEFKINEFNIFKNLKFNTYYIKELSPGNGYLLNENTYKVEITPNNSNIELKIPNKVIEKKIIINKKYGDNNTFFNENNITFKIYNSKKELVKELTTDDRGIIETILPFGEYEIVQETTTPGYHKIEPFNISVTDSEEEYIELKDYRIKVPNTYTNKSIFIIILRLLLLIC